MGEIIKGRLESKERELGRLQEYFKIDLKNIQSPDYEDSAINALLKMKEIKIVIAELKASFYERENQ